MWAPSPQTLGAPAAHRWRRRGSSRPSTAGAILLVLLAACGSTAERAAPPSSAVSSTTTDSPADNEGATILYGTVSATPTCPVQRPGQSCPPAPVTGTVRAVDGADHVVGQAPTDANGHYEMPVAPGSYTLHVVIDGVLPRCPDTTAVAAVGKRTNVDIGCDTGIR